MAKILQILVEDGATKEVLVDAKHHAEIEVRHISKPWDITVKFMIFILGEALASLEDHGQKTDSHSHGSSCGTNLTNLDVKFVFKCGATLHAHNEKLVAASSYFASQFNQHWSNSDGVYRTDYPFPAMKAMVAFIYSDGKTLEEDLTNIQDLLETLELAHVVGMPELLALVETRLKFKISPKSLKEILVTSHGLGSELSNLKKACFEFINNNLHPESFQTSVMDSILAIKHEDEVLWKELMKSLKDSLTIDTLKETLLLADRHGLSDLKTACFDLVGKNWWAAMSGNDDCSASLASIFQDNQELWKEMCEATRPHNSCKMD